MQAIRIYAVEGESRFCEHEIALLPKDKFGLFSAPVPATDIFFRETAADYDSGWHTAPFSLYLVILEGAVEIETSDGCKQVIGAGGVILAEDTTGKGHRTRAVGGQLVRSMMLGMPDTR
ncbi:MAG TPA: hypothetical protein VJ698_05920 [Noviherbaspirillum sp.]|uniref:hypothetical protein n=1 Tax=Noviherbaspirillum sp. TaxID=1926288 RepID=UPI002B49CDF7|nr:hypothetical protein [Noviherbaspirillum sp.]HJV84992.1 hypothetical protein [Noviherbaspirillum sp.]